MINSGETDIFEVIDEVNYKIRPIGTTFDVSGTIKSCIITCTSSLGLVQTVYQGSKNAGVSYLVGVIAGVDLAKTMYR